MQEKGYQKAQFHLPGLFEFYEFYKVFLPNFHEHREFFYDWAAIASIYGAPPDCIWAGGRFEGGENNPEEVLKLLSRYNISARLTFSNSLLREEHLADKKCNKLCAIFEKQINQPQGDKQLNENPHPKNISNGVIVHSDLLAKYLQDNYPNLYLVSSTTKVQTDFDEFVDEVSRVDFKYVVPDFRLNKQLDKLNTLTTEEKAKVEFLCNECCYIGCTDRKACYENVSRRVLDETCEEHVCKAPGGNEGYKFSKAMKNPAFISIEDIQEKYLPNGFTNFKIEGRGLGNAVLLEMLLYYLAKPEYHLQIREMVYLDSMLNLF